MDGHDHGLDAVHFFEAKLAFTTGPIEVSRMIENGSDIIIVDVRAAEDYEKGHIPGATSLPKDTWDGEGISGDKLLIFYCYAQQCHLAAQAAFAFAKRGYSVMEMEGGWLAWESLGLPAQKSPEPANAE